VTNNWEQWSEEHWEQWNEETQHLKPLADKLEHNNSTSSIPLDTACIACEIEIDANLVGDVLNGIRFLLDYCDSPTTGEFLLDLGAAIGEEYLCSDLAYDEPTADAAQWFLPE
jgi:hypothetical protein